jgi:hypothetical protein
MLLGFIAALADALPPEHVAAARSGGRAGLYVAGLAAVAAVVLAAALIRRRR